MTISLTKLGETKREDQTSALFSILSEIDALQKQEYQAELTRIKNKEPSDYPKTIYVYDRKKIPADYVGLTQTISSVFMLRKYARRVFRNVKKKVYVMPSMITVMTKEYPVYAIYSPIPEPTTAIIPITRRRP
jgi:hypothetical protein